MGYACGAELGYIYVRGEYPLAEARVQHAVEAARARGFLGADVMGEGFSFDIEVRRGAGAYIAGEETALINSLEGKRAEPRNKPPFPVTHGLHGKPTAINNVETFVMVPSILAHGPVQMFSNHIPNIAMRNVRAMGNLPPDLHQRWFADD